MLRCTISVMAADVIFICIKLWIRTSRNSYLSQDRVWDKKHCYPGPTGMDPSTNRYYSIAKSVLNLVSMISKYD